MMWWQQRHRACFKRANTYYAVRYMWMCIVHFLEKQWKLWQNNNNNKKRKQPCLKSLSENPGTMSLNKQNQHNWNDLNRIEHNILLHILDGVLYLTSHFALPSPFPCFPFSHSATHILTLLAFVRTPNVRLHNFHFNMICCYDLHTFSIINHKKVSGRERILAKANIMNYESTWLLFLS